MRSLGALPKKSWQRPPVLVLASTFIDPATLSALQRLGFRVEAFGSPATVKDSIAQVRRVTALTGHLAAGERLAAAIAQAAAPRAGWGRPISSRSKPCSPIRPNSCWWQATVLAGTPRWILADEPLAALDLAHQLSLVAHLRRCAADGQGVVVVLHDLSLAMNHADRVLVLQGGCLIADGPPAQALAPSVIVRGWGVKAEWLGAPGAMALRAGT